MAENLPNEITIGMDCEGTEYLMLKEIRQFNSMVNVTPSGMKLVCII